MQAFESSTNASISSSARALIHCWNGDARLGILANSEPDRYKWVWPSEGANLWQDNWAIVKGAPPRGRRLRVHQLRSRSDRVAEGAHLHRLQHRSRGHRGSGHEGRHQAPPDLVFIPEAIMSKLVYSKMTSADGTIIGIYDELKAAAGK